MINAKKLVYWVENRLRLLRLGSHLSVLLSVHSVPLLSLTWPSRWHCVDRCYPNTQGGDGPGSRHHLPETDRELDRKATMLD